MKDWLARWSWVSLGRWLASWLWAPLVCMADALRCWVTLTPWLAYKSWVSLLIGLAYPAGISLCLGLAYRSRDFSLFRARSLSVGSSKDVARSCRLGYYLCLGSLLPDGLLLFLGINNSRCLATSHIFYSACANRIDTHFRGLTHGRADNAFCACFYRQLNSVTTLCDVLN